MQNNWEKVALFDFCETLVDFQTADAYVNYVRERTGRVRMRRIELFQNILLKTFITPVLEKLTSGKFAINKRLKLSQLKGLSCQELGFLARGYYEDRIKPHFIARMIDELVKLKEAGYCIGIVSGGYGIYEKFFVDEFGLNFLLCSNIQIGENGVCTGKMEGKDCMNENKVEYLNKLFTNKPSRTVAYSDSISDLPFLKWADEGFVVSRNNHQNWSCKNNLKEIIWKD